MKITKELKKIYSISVGFMLKDIGCDSETVVSGLLHDIIEDTDYDYDFIKSEFGETVANNVLNLSENIDIESFEERKRDFITNLYNQNNNIVLIEVADKLHNLLSDYNLWEKKGKDAIATLNTTYEMNKWYYFEMQKLFNDKLKSNDLLDRYNNLVNIYFNENN